MGAVARRSLGPVLAVSLASALCACQTAEQKPQVQATVQPSNMDSDIRRILVAGGLDANAPGNLQTTKMPAEVQQAVAALQGSPLPAAAPAAVPGAPAVAAPAPPPMMAALPPGRGRKGRAAAPQFALAPAPAPAPAVAQAVPPAQALAYAGQATGLPLNPAQAAPIPSSVAQAAAQASQLSQVQSFLPPPPPQFRTVVLTGPNADRRAAQAAIARVAVPSPRATQAAVAAMQPPARALAAVPVAAPAPAAPEEPRVRRF